MESKHIELEAPAKVNLFLEVGARRSDGFHEVETVMHTLALSDAVSLELGVRPDAEQPGFEISLECDTDLGIPPRENLAYKAAEAFISEFCPPCQGQRLRITLDKRIPSKAGLGGGSSDAAAVLKGLCELFGLEAGDERVESLASRLGSDVPFFLRGGCALMRGKGDAFVRSFEPLCLDVVVAKRPDAGIDTAQAYRCFDADPKPTLGVSGILEALCMADPKKRVFAACRAFYNNLEPAVGSIDAGISRLLASLRQRSEVESVLLCGSGACVFAAMPGREAAQSLADELSAHGLWACATRMK